ncbi:hypothetical protein [Pseudogulbenkiania sp. MAI-1]|uniref:hypothetical protein n=1 Tax=Pseudogulbenkiania sp. MAI-1 TaxID=990370 RepID=UPI0012EC5F22|nr:hypothetical protein [Pseudogulbenkiania sp. MAI-1]
MNSAIKRFVARLLIVSWILAGIVTAVMAYEKFNPIIDFYSYRKEVFSSKTFNDLPGTEEYSKYYGLSSKYSWHAFFNENKGTNISQDSSMPSNEPIVIKNNDRVPGRNLLEVIDTNELLEIMKANEKKLNSSISNEQKEQIVELSKRYFERYSSFNASDLFPLLGLGFFLSMLQFLFLGSWNPTNLVMLSRVK